MKTGFVCASGYNMVASATGPGRTLVAVVLGAGSQTERAVAAARLLSQGFDETHTSSGSIYRIPNPELSRKPDNMRSILCSEEAKALRYDPGAGQAKIDSEYLQSRTPSTNILKVSIGGVDAAPGAAYLTRLLSPAGKIPVPVKSPGHTPSSQPQPEATSPIAATTVGKIPIPRPRPR